MTHIAKACLRGGGLSVVLEDGLVDGVGELVEVFKVLLHLRSQHHVHDALTQRAVVVSRQILEDVNRVVLVRQAESQTGVVILQYRPKKEEQEKYFFMSHAQG